MNTKKKHGGKRTGAGRKPVDELGGKAVQIFLPLSLLSIVDAEAERLAVSRSELVRNSLLAYLSE